jgi:D-beta-D-heptose 7-phosphate kinase/D-beta-D-heptose 1-phosphate adenosyltransferase
MSNELSSVINEIAKKNILVIGDAILDESIFTEAIGLSLETPTLKVRKKYSETTFGGAANVANNCIALGAKCHFLTVLGNDTLLPIYKKWFHSEDRLTVTAVPEDERANVCKSRYWVSRGDGLYKHLQINTGDDLPISCNTKEVLKTIVSNIACNFDVVLFVDYQLGIFSDSTFVQRLVSSAKASGALVIASSQKSSNKANHSWFTGSDLISMNYDEAKANDDRFSGDLSILSKKLNSEICVTVGSRGSYLTADKSQYHCAALPVDVKDTCGAGDAFLACISLQDWKNKPHESLKLSNTWAALSVTKSGTAAPSIEELLLAIRELRVEEYKE